MDGVWALMAPCAQFCHQPGPGISFGKPREVGLLLSVSIFPSVKWVQSDVPYTLDVRFILLFFLLVLLPLSFLPSIIISPSRIYLSIIPPSIIHSSSVFSNLPLNTHTHTHTHTRSQVTHLLNGWLMLISEVQVFTRGHSILKGQVC